MKSHTLHYGVQYITQHNIIERDQKQLMIYIHYILAFDAKLKC